MQKRKHKRKSFEIEEAANEHIRVYFEQAEKKFNEDPKLSHRYVQLARRIAMKFKVKLTSVQKRKFCKHCYKFLMPGKNCRVRTKDKKLIYYCLECKNYNRFGFK